MMSITFLRRSIALWLACLTGLTGLSSPTPDDTFDEDPYFLLMGEADDAIAAENWPEAAARLADALAVKPDHPSNVLVMNNLASVYGFMGRDSLAVATYNEALERAPRMLTLWLGRGKALSRLGRRAEALADFDRALAIDSLSADALDCHGAMAMALSDVATAEADYLRLEAIDPQSAIAARTLATLYMLDGRAADARPRLRSLLTLDPDAGAYFLMAECLIALNELSEASETLTAGLEKYPNSPRLYDARAHLNRARFRYDDARADARRAARLRQEISEK